MKIRPLPKKKDDLLAQILLRNKNVVKIMNSFFDITQINKKKINNNLTIQKNYDNFLFRVAYLVVQEYLKLTND